ncbi:uncharacterized protein LOC133814470 [Humulus lupulus]|uniref:uncharacterized protein LOC133814470 n=1 Tax=Humulus lupulus TaxID=3486 RepID=UPI002B40B636|nr:uncharacterized protein LOC133814470 [Humulus lupulus]
MVSKFHNGNLSSIPADSEILDAFQQIDPNKAPMHDGMSNIISPMQSVFIKGRIIHDNAMIAKEIIHSMNRRKDKDGFMLMKRDMENAYDRVDWGFLQHVLTCWGFSNTFIRWIMLCVSTSHFTLLLNGSHFDGNNSQKLKLSLNVLISTTTGLVVNNAKLSVYFSRGVAKAKAIDIADFLNMKIIRKDNRYLTLPMLSSRAPTTDFNFILEKVKARVQGLKAKLLSKAARATLVQSVSPSLVSYVVASGPIPIAKARNMDRILR